MRHRFRLYWFRETGCDAGTLVNEDGLDPAVRERIVALAGDGNEPIDVHLPFLDRREASRRQESLEHVSFTRVGNVIRPSPKTANAALRNYAAELLQLNPAWIRAEREHEANYFFRWQKISLHLQKQLRERLLSRYTNSVEALEDRDRAYPVLVYAASRPFFGRPRTEFTYDVADPETLDSALKLMGRPLQSLLEGIEARLRQSGKPELAHRYAPVWHEDFRREVLKRPKAFLSILGDEATFVNSVIDMGTSARMSAVKPFARTALSALRNVHRMDLRDLAIPLLDEATRVLETVATRRELKHARSSTSQFERAALCRESSAPGTYGHYMPDSAASL